ncbi:MAG: DUF4256 domain-containing protein [Bacteroidia bacterium]|nr:DUF4256 domain-containing protein [Bacteroidia bacterium]
MKSIQLEIDNLLIALKNRFDKNMHRHEGINWKDIETRIINKPNIIKSIIAMEQTGGEPDVVILNKKSNEIVICDCACESPKERRSLCYDNEALETRKEHKPKNSAVNMANEMGIELLTEEQYIQLQAIEKFDTKTSSWLATPSNVRKLGGAIFGDFRFGRVFIYHNGAESYYAARGFRGFIKI